MNVGQMTASKLIWATPDGDKLVGYLARVSNPNATPDQASDRLIRYLIRNKHWSPFEMVNACVEINSTREVIRQILRHRSFSFQEFSGRYAAYENEPIFSEARLQDTKNRQNSIAVDDKDTNNLWFKLQLGVWDFCWGAYQTALKMGIAKELARKVLPEGLVPSKLYMNGTLRSWIHYWDTRCTPETQKEHRIIAEEIRTIILREFPEIAKVIGYDQNSIS